jgi:hypothetical protein
MLGTALSEVEVPWCRNQLEDNTHIYHFAGGAKATQRPYIVNGSRLPSNGEI